VGNVVEKFGVTLEQLVFSSGRLKKVLERRIRNKVTVSHLLSPDEKKHFVYSKIVFIFAVLSHSVKE